MNDKFTNVDYTFMLEARLWASRSKDPSRRIGAIIARGKTHLSTGYNGFPSRTPDKEELLNNREEKYKRTIHAEINCILNALKNGVNISGSTLYVYGLPTCSKCAPLIIGAEIDRVIYCDISSENSVWEGEGKITEELFKEAGVQLFSMEKKDLDTYAAMCYKGL